MSAATPTAAPRRHAGRAGAPRCEWGTAPAAASPKHTWPPARRARAAAPASHERGGLAGERARPALWRHAWRRTDRETDPPPMPAPAAPPPGQATSAFHPVRQRTASGETAPRPPTARWRSCLLHTDGTARPAPATGGRRRAECAQRHGGTATPTAAAGHTDGEDTGWTGPTQRTGYPARRASTPPHRPPTHRPTPHPGRPSLRPSQDRGRRAWRHRRRRRTGPGLKPGPGWHRSPPPPRPLHFLSVPLTGTCGVVGSTTTACLQFEGGARASKGAYTFH